MILAGFVDEGGAAEGEAGVEDGMVIWVGGGVARWESGGGLSCTFMGWGGRGMGEGGFTVLPVSWLQL